MRLITVAAAALLVVLAGYGIADASVLTLSVTVANTQLSLTGGADGPTSTTYTVFGMVTNNTTNDGYVDFSGGLSQFVVNQTYSSAGIIGHLVAAGPPSQTNAATTIQSPFTGTVQAGTVVDGLGVASHTGTGGVRQTAGARPTIGDAFDYYTPGHEALYQSGLNTPVALFTGTINAIANGTVTITFADNANLNSKGQSLVYKVDAAGLYSSVIDTLIPAIATIHVGPAETTNNPPTGSIPGGDVHEDNWSKEPGWNNLEHKVVITAVGVDDGNPIPPGALSYEWIMTRPGAGSVTLGEHGGVLTLKLDDIKSLGLPDYPGEIWNLSVTAFDGEKYSVPDGIGVFVPEPATIGLLAFGVVGLLRRRRRA